MQEFKFLTEEEITLIKEEHERYQNHIKICPLCWLKYWNSLEERPNERPNESSRLSRTK